MTRKKVKLAFIANSAARKSSFNKRMKGLMKKVEELSTLCGVDACAIVYSPYTDGPELFPKAEDNVARVLWRFQKMTLQERSNKMVNQHQFLRKSIDKANDQLRRLRRENKDKEMTRLVFEALASTDTNAFLNGLTVSDLNHLGTHLDHYLRDVEIILENNNY